MEVRIIKATENPMDVIAFAAGICYGKRDTNPRRVRACFKAEHLSVFEHASVTFIAEGISRACLAQLTRHRLASYCVESQRYTRIDTCHDDWYIIPPSFESDEAYFRKCMREYASHYQVCVAGGTKPEDARSCYDELPRAFPLPRHEDRRGRAVGDPRLGVESFRKVGRLFQTMGRPDANVGRCAIIERYAFGRVFPFSSGCI